MYLVAGWYNRSGGNAASSEQPRNGNDGTGAGGISHFGYLVSVEKEGDE